MTTLRIFAIGCLAAASLWAARNATGKWSGQMPLRNGSTTEVQLILKTNAPYLTGTIRIHNRLMEISKGREDGDTVSFDVVRDAGDRQLKQHFRGTVAGDTMHLSVTRRRDAPPGAWTAQIRSPEGQETIARGAKVIIKHGL
jgi:hypothetical protein